MDSKFKKWDIVIADLPKTRGSVQYGKRPAVIIQGNIGNLYSPTLLVIPLTKKIKNLSQPTHTLIRKDEMNGLKYDSMLLAEQTTTVDKESVEKMGNICDPVTRNKIFTCFVNSSVYGDPEAPQMILVKGGRASCIAR